MARLNDLFIQQDNESVEIYDNRITESSYQHIGYAFFERSNYDNNHHTFSIYIIWNDKINSIIEDPYPNTGFVIHCSEKIADCLTFEQEGQPVFGKFISCNKRINITDLIIRYFDRNYVVSYTGCYTAIPENVYFKGISKVEQENYKEYLPTRSTTKVNGSFTKKDNSSFSIGSFNLDNFKNSSFFINYFNNSSFKSGVLAGSFGIGSYNKGSFKNGLLATSFNKGSFNNSSFNLANYNLGSFNWGIFNLGSYNLSSFNLSSFNLGSFSMNNRNFGSFNSTSFELVSFNRSSFNNGSFNRGSFNNTSFFINSNNRTSFSGECYNCLSNIAFEDFLKEIFGIGFMGYGLNLL